MSTPPDPQAPTVREELDATCDRTPSHTNEVQLIVFQPPYAGQKVTVGWEVSKPWRSYLAARHMGAYRRLVPVAPTSGLLVPLQGAD